MTFLIFKYLITAGVVVLISETAKRSDKLGAFIAALPVITILVMIWLYIEKQPSEKIANHAYYTFFYVIPTLPMFILFPWIMNKTNFWITLMISVIITTISFFILAYFLKKFDINLV